MSLANIGEQFSGLPMENLIGGPLMASADANAKMALTQTNFILSIGFNKEKIGGTDEKPQYKYEPIMVDLSFTRVIKDGDETRSESLLMPLPLISLVPINSLAVTNVDIHFEMEVKSTSTESDKRTSESEFSTSLSGGSRFWQPVRINASVSYSSKDRSESDNQYTKSNSAKYTIDVKAQQLPLPVGVSVLLDMYTKNMTPKEIQ